MKLSLLHMWADGKTKKMFPPPLCGRIGNQRTFARLYSEEGTAYFLKHFVAPDSEYRNKVEAGQETVFGAYDDDRLIGVITVSEHGNISCAFVEKAYQR